MTTHPAALPAPLAVSAGDTAWLLAATALVLLMAPGLALFYGGMVRSKNILSVMMQCFAITGLITILWFVYGYSMAFDTTGMEAGVVNLNSFVGGLSKLFLSGVTPASITGPGQQPSQNISQANAIFFLIYNLMGGVVILTLFIRCVWLCSVALNNSLCYPVSSSVISRRGQEVHS